MQWSNTNQYLKTQINFQKQTNLEKQTNFEKCEQNFQEYTSVSENTNQFPKTNQNREKQTKIQERPGEESTLFLLDKPLVCTAHAEAIFCSKSRTHSKEEFRFCTKRGQEHPEQGPQQGTPVASTVQKRAAPTLDE